MQTLRQAARLRDDAGQKLRDVWTSLVGRKVHLRRGQLHLLSAAPGGFKSTVTLNWVLKSRARTLYVSPDTDGRTMAIRAVQLVALVDQDTAERAVDGEERIATDALEAIDYVRFAFPASPSITDIVHHVYAYGEAEGEWPHLIVIDNLMDVSYEEDENRGLNRIMEELAKLARNSKAAVLVLHHTTGEFESGDLPIPMSGLRQKVSKKPALILTMNRGAGEGQLWVSVVKNRFGPADPSGLGIRAELLVHPEFMQVYDPERRSV